MTGLQWLFSGSSMTTYLKDVRLPFGAAKSCQIFQRLSNAIVRMMARRGHNCVGYLDDFIVIEDNVNNCQVAYDCLYNLLEELGFVVNVQKAVPPCSKLIFLGIEIDTRARSLALPARKLLEVKGMLADWSGKRRAKKVEIQRLLGRLNWCARVIRGAEASCVA